MGLVDAVVDPYALRKAAIQAADELANKKLRVSKKKKPLFSKLLEDNPIGVLFSFLPPTPDLCTATQAAWCCLIKPRSKWPRLWGTTCLHHTPSWTS